MEPGSIHTLPGSLFKLPRCIGLDNRTQVLYDTAACLLALAIRWRGSPFLMKISSRFLMAKLIYLMLMSLDGFIADENGNFDWAEPDEEVHSFVNQLVRPIGTHLYGRRMYEVMTYWETLETDDPPHYIREFAELWQAADKVVYSRTLKAVSTARTGIERRFDSEAVRRLKAAAQNDISVSGPTLAAEAFRAGLIDICHLFIAPIMVGNGTSALPSGVRTRLNLQEERRFGNGMVYLQYRTAYADAPE